MTAANRGPESVELVSRSAEETRSLGQLLGRSAQLPFFCAVVGELGAGKTVLTQGLVAGLGSSAQARSPSFCLVNEYGGPPSVYHFDCYRLQGECELQAMGYEEYFFDPHAAVIVEWADRIPRLLPPDYLEVVMEMKDIDTRRILLIAHGEHYALLLRALEGARG